MNTIRYIYNTLNLISDNISWFSHVAMNGERGEILYYLEKKKREKNTRKVKPSII